MTEKSKRKGLLGFASSGKEAKPPKPPKPPKKRRVSVGFTRRDLVNEALEGVGSRPSRLFITLVGTVLGIASLVATIGLAQTAAGNIAKKFDELAATRVVIEPGKTEGADKKEKITAKIPWDAVSRVSDLAGVEEASLYAQVPSTATVSAVQVIDPAEVPAAPPAIVAGSPELLDVVEGELQTGRFFDSGHDERADRVVVLGSRVAESMGINRVSSQPAIFIGDTSYAVIGILDTVGTHDDLLDSIIMPVGTARADLGLTTVGSLEIRIAIGAGQVVAHQAPIALAPNNPDAFKVKAPSTSEQLKDGVASDINVLFIAIGVVALIGGGIGIANVTLLSVTERRGEIGLRRALGARTRQIAEQFMLESLTTGVLGGLIGVSVGMFVLLGICVAQQWTPVISPWAAPAGVVIGALVGLVSGTYPAIKAARIEPVDALRSA